MRITAANNITDGGRLIRRLKGIADLHHFYSEDVRNATWISKATMASKVTVAMSPVVFCVSQQ
jgi:hypothetical protein